MLQNLSKHNDINWQISMQMRMVYIRISNENKENEISKIYLIGWRCVDSTLRNN